jgi:tetratricopeptide (TPR) repeat protein
MSKTSDIQKMLGELLSQKRLAFLVGAGVSIPAPSNMMSGNSFTSGVIARIASNKKIGRQLRELCESERQDRRNDGDFIRFEGLMQTLQENCDPNLDILSCFSDCIVPNRNHHVLASLIHKGHFVFTTNFDNLIELAFHNPWDCCALINEKEFYDYFKDRKALSSSRGNKRKLKNPLFKLHGSLKRYDGNGWVDSRESIKATLRAVGKSGDQLLYEPAKRQALSSVVQKYDLVVLGYSGYDDFDIGSLLRSIPSERKVIWINHCAQERMHTYVDFVNGQRDKNGNFLRKREECLYEMGHAIVGAPARNPDSLFLFDLDTDKAFDLLIRIHSTSLPQLGSDHHFEEDAFFAAWEQKHLTSNGEKWIVCGHLFRSLGRQDQALHAYKESLRHFCKGKDESRVAISRQNIGSILEDQGNYDEALQHFRKALAIEQKQDNAARISDILHSMGLAYQLKGDYDRATKLYERSLRLQMDATEKKLPIDPSSVSCTLFQLAILLRERGKYDEAIKCHQQSISIDRKEGNIRGVSQNLYQLAILHELSGEFDESLQLYNKVLSRAGDIGDQRLCAGALHQMAMVHERRGNFDAAMEMYRESIRIKELLGDKKGLSRTLIQIARIHHARGDDEQAMSIYQKLPELKEASIATQELAATWHNMGLACRDRGDQKTALELFQKALSVYDSLGDKCGRSKVYNDIGTICQDQKEYDQALAMYTKSLDIKEQLGDKQGIALTLHNIGSIHHMRGETDAALCRYQASRSMAEDLRDRLLFAANLLNEGQILFVIDSREQGLRNVFMALSVFDELGSPKAQAAARILQMMRQNLGNSLFQKYIDNFRREILDAGYTGFTS